MAHAEDHHKTGTLQCNFTRFFSGTLISRVSGMLREMATAASFGAAPTFASFVMAFRFAFTVRRLFGEGTLNAVFIPRFEQLRATDSDAAFSLFISLKFLLLCALSLLLSLLAVIFSLCALFLPLPEQWQQTMQYAMILLPSILFICLYAVNSALLQCNKSFFLPAIAPAAFNIVWIAAVFLLYETPVNIAMPYFCMGIIVASIVQWAITCPKSIRLLKEHNMLQKSLWQIGRKMLFDPQLRSLIQSWTVVAIGVGANQINNLIDPMFALHADAAGPAFLWFALRIEQLPLALFGITLSSVLLPSLSKALQAKDVADYESMRESALRRCINFMLPSTTFLFALGLVSVQLIYQYGDFTAADALHTTLCLWGYTLGLLPSTCILIFSSCYYAKDNYHFPMKLAFAAIFCNVFFNSLFIWILQWGAMSVAVATSISNILNCIILSYALARKEKKQIWNKQLLYYGGKVLFCSLCAAFMALMIGNRYFDDHTWQLLQGNISEIHSMKNIQTIIINFVCQTMSFVGVLWIGHRTLKIF